MTRGEAGGRGARERLPERPSVCEPRGRGPDEQERRRRGGTQHRPPAPMTAKPIGTIGEPSTAHLLGGSTEGSMLCCHDTESHARAHGFRIIQAESSDVSG